MTQVLGPIGPQSRFPRSRYLRQLLQLQAELEQWAHAYAIQGVDNRAEVLGEVARFAGLASNELMQIKR